MNELALFAGAGGGILGGKLLGWRTVCAVEINSFARKVLLARQRDGILPRFPIWDDIRTFNARQWKGFIDIVTGGFPCQRFSTATRGRATAEDLWPEMLRVVIESKAACVSAENVSRAAIEIAAEDLLDLGYTPRAIKVSASDLGADHERERYGYLHTPTCTANYCAPSMQKWPGCRNFVRAFGRVTPTNQEWMMGWPTGWTDLQPLGTDKFQQWLNSHSKH